MRPADRLVGYQAKYKTHEVRRDKLVIRDGFSRFKHATADGEGIVLVGEDLGSAVTAGRVAAGFLLGGPFGAVIGALAKKDAGQAVAAFTWPDGTTAKIVAPRHDAEKLREFVDGFNQSAIATSQLATAGA